MALVTTESLTRPPAGQRWTDPDRPGSSRLAALRTEWRNLGPGDRRLAMVRAVGVLIWIAIPICLFLWPQNGMAPYVEWPGTRIVWTIIVAFLPIGIVAVGYYNWRQSCPLMFFARMSEWIGWPDQRSTPARQRRRRFVPPWVARNYPLITWGMLFILLTLRILVINSDTRALAWTFIGLLTLAMFVGFVYTGKSWCNFFCPVSIVEKIYTDGDRPQWRENSQCPTCTRCKTELTRGLCPDINQENDYWQELKNGARSFAYYAFPGLVLGFYTWYFLHRPDYWNQMHGIAAPGHEIRGHDGIYDWGYYLSGDWTRETHPLRHLMDRGFGFSGAPYIPTVLAAPLTLAAFALVSYFLFKLAEKAWVALRVSQGDQPDAAIDKVRHPLFAWAGFIAFNIFYMFAGAPTLRELPLGIYALLQFIVIVFSASVLYTRLRGTRMRLWKFDQARKWLSRWPWSDEPPPSDLDEAYNAYTLRAKFSEGRLQAFKDVVRGSLAENLVTPTQLAMLDRLASDLGVDEADQKRIMREIAREYPELLDPTTAGSLDDRLRLIGYRGELERALSSGALPTEAELRQMQERYRVDAEEHQEIMLEVLDPEGLRARQLRAEVDEIRVTQHDLALLTAYPAPPTIFLSHELRDDLAHARHHVLEVANLYGPPGALVSMGEPILGAGRGSAANACDWINYHLPAQVAGLVIDALFPEEPADRVETDEMAFTETLLRIGHNLNRYTSSAAICALERVIDQPDALNRARLALQDPDSLRREAAIGALGPQLTPEEWEDAIHDPSAAVREAALLKAAAPLRPSLRPLVAGAADDPDHNVAAAASALLEDEAAARPAGAHRLSRLEKVFALRNVPLFEHLPVEHLYDLAARAEEATFEPGDPICSEGRIGDAVYILLEGQAEVLQTRRGEPVRIGMSQAGECVGEMSILDPGPQMATVQAVTVVRTLTVRGEAFRSLIGRDPTSAFSIIRLMIRRQRATSELAARAEEGGR